MPEESMPKHEFERSLSSDENSHFDDHNAAALQRHKEDGVTR